ncbi:MAG: hypothetical protein LC808_10355 [Actinobacteria bacterium]|nr:hypothetical protein [Actinomycetota bacterium]
MRDFIGEAQELDGAAGGAYLNFSGDDATEETVEVTAGRGRDGSAYPPEYGITSWALQDDALG